MKQFYYKLFSRHFVIVVFVIIWTNSAFSQDVQNVDKQKAQIEKEINDITSKTNWQNANEANKATQRLTELSNKLNNLSVNQVTETLKNTEMDVSANLGEGIKSDFEKDEPAKKTSGTDSSVIMLYLTKSSVEDFDALDRLYDFPNLEIVYINGDKLDKILEFNDIINKLSAVPVKELYLVGFTNSLTQIPENIGELNNLRVLGLYGNSLTQIPEFLCSFSNLNAIYLDTNPITKLPDQIGTMKNLKLLGLKKTQVSSSEIERLKKLLPDCDIQK